MSEHPTPEELDDMAEEARMVFRERPACKSVYLGGSVHEGDQSSWNVYAYGSDEYVGTVIGGSETYQGTLFHTDFQVTDSTIATVLLHLGIELGRVKRRESAP